MWSPLSHLIDETTVDAHDASEQLSAFLDVFLNEVDTKTVSVTQIHIDPVLGLSPSAVEQPQRWRGP